jgi:TonB family protein
MTETEFQEQKQTLLAISDPLGLLRYGAAELKEFYGRNLGKALVISVALHLALIALFLFWPEDETKPEPPKLTEIKLNLLPVPKKPEEMVILDDVGSSGALHSKEPKGPAMRGDRRYAPDPFIQNKERTTPNNPTPPKDMKPVGSKPIPTNRETATPQASGPLDRDSLARAHSTSGSIGGGAGGTGSQGTGGGGTGSLTDGLGTRGWAVRPKAVYPQGANSTGTVRLQFTVLPNGQITSIKPSKVASRELLNAAMAGLQRARAKALPESAPQVPQQAWITFNFVLKE